MARQMAAQVDSTWRQQQEQEQARQLQSRCRRGSSSCSSSSMLRQLMHQCQGQVWVGQPHPGMQGCSSMGKCADVPGSSSSSSEGWTKVWLSFGRLLPANTSVLLCALATSCGLSLDGPAPLTGSRCGLAVRQALLGAGMLGIDGPEYDLWMTDDPMVSLAIRLAVGITPSQAAAGTDAVLGAWLAAPANVYAGIRASGLPDRLAPMR